MALTELTLAGEDARVQPTATPALDNLQRLASTRERLEMLIWSVTAETVR